MSSTDPWERTATGSSSSSSARTVVLQMMRSEPEYAAQDREEAAQGSAELPRPARLRAISPAAAVTAILMAC